MNFEVFLFRPFLFEHWNHLAGATFAFKRVPRVVVIANYVINDILPSRSINLCIARDAVEVVTVPNSTVMAKFLVNALFIRVGDGGGGGQGTQSRLPASKIPMELELAECPS